MVSLDGITSLPNITKIYQLFKKLLGMTNRQTGDLISLFSFLKSTLRQEILGGTNLPTISTVCPNLVHHISPV
jgi:hypothetical protein